MEQLFIRTWQFWPHYEKQNGSIWQKSTDAKCFLIPLQNGRDYNLNLGVQFLNTEHYGGIML